jgi:hypothetical protein
MKSRVYAAMIDSVLFIIMVMFTGKYGFELLGGHIFKNCNPFYIPLYCISVYIFIYYCLLDLIFYTSPGKWLYDLKIRTVTYQKPPRHLILLRSTMKVLLLFSLIGGVLICIALLNNLEPFYDRALGLTVIE